MILVEVCYSAEGTVLSACGVLSGVQAELLAELEGEMFDLRDQLAQAAGETEKH